MPRRAGRWRFSRFPAQRQGPGPVFRGRSNSELLVDGRGHTDRTPALRHDLTCGCMAQNRQIRSPHGRQQVRQGGAHASATGNIEGNRTDTAPGLKVILVQVLGETETTSDRRGRMRRLATSQFISSCPARTAVSIAARTRSRAWRVRFDRIDYRVRGGTPRRLDRTTSRSQAVRVTLTDSQSVPHRLPANSARGLVSPVAGHQAAAWISPDGEVDSLASDCGQVR